MNTSYPERKALQFTAEQWAAVRAFRFEHQINTDAEAVRTLLDLALRHGLTADPDWAPPGSVDTKPKRKSQKARTGTRSLAQIAATEKWLATIEDGKRVRMGLAPAKRRAA